MNSKSWRRCHAPTVDDRLRQYHARLGVSEEELLRRQALGLRVREQMVRRAFQIPRHRALVVVEHAKRPRRRSKRA